MTTLPFTNFTKGEIAPELHARIDTDQYKAGAKKVRNFLIQRYGGLSFRPGFRFVAEADSVSNNVRYIPFQYNIEQAYIMVFENRTLRLLASGGFVIEDNLKITAITKESNARVDAAYHGYEVNDRVYFKGITGMTQLNGRTATVVGVGEGYFTIDIDTTDFSDFVSSSGIVRTSDPIPVVPPISEPDPPDPPPPAETGGGGGVDLGGYRDLYYGGLV